jgi:ATP-dependent Clp protease ATP-binding subunit ClpA/ATP-dependent Clp protease ATP-binding subunit ClpC
VSFTIPIYVTPLADGRQEWTTLGLGPHTISRKGVSELKLQQALIGDLKQLVRKLEPEELELLALRTGLRLERLRLDLTLRGEGGKRKLTGLFPVILEPRWFNREARLQLCYHPARQRDWFPLEGEAELEERAALYFSRAWESLAETEIHELQTGGKDRLRVLSFSAEHRTVLDKLPKRKGGLWDDLRVDPFKKGEAKAAGGGLKLLRELGIDLTQRASELSLALGMPRSPYREQLQLLLGGEGRRSTIVVGPPQVGKTTLIHTLVADRLDADGYWAHRNLDRVCHVFSLSGQRIIAGMSYVGDWEQRCMELLEETAGKAVVLAIEDVAAWGRLGRSRESDRNLAELFRGPLARGEVTMIGECNPEQLARLEDDAPSFAAQFSRVHVAETSASETLRMLIAEARSLELSHDVAFDPLLWRHLIELAGSLLSASAFPGKALELLRELDRTARRGQPAASGGARVQVGSDELLELLSQRTGLPEALLRLDAELDPEEVRLDFARQVMGQQEAVAAARDLVLRLRTGLTEPRRPCAVYLFTGPTGTGKTELAKCIAEYLYGDASRLVRLDMGEYSDGGAPGRLAGDLFQPRGILTDQLMQQPFCVLLLDEVEKAHASVLHLMLQIFDEGRLTDAAGNTADFSHAVVILTSNLGSKLAPPAGFAESADAVADDALRAVREFFPPELYNRIDRVLRFRPLDREAARLIAQKELAALLGRRGLSDRNIFVYPSGRVLDRVVAGGFDPLLGARPLKRFLEREVGTLLAEHVSASPGTLMQIVRLHTDERAPGGGFRLHAETLAEAQPVASELPLEPLLGLPVRELRALLPGALDFLDGLLESDRLAELGERLSFHLGEHARGGEASGAHAETLYNLESMRSQLRGLRGKIGYYHGREGQRTDRRALLQALAEAQFLRRALETVEDPGQHAIFIELLHLGLARRQQRFGEPGAALMTALTSTYLEQRVMLEGWALRDADGGIREGAGKLETSVLEKRPEQLVLRLIGLGALDFFGGENGCHVWRSLGHGSDVLRVRVWSDDGARSPRAVIESHRAALAAFEEALEAGEPLPENPERLLPLTREYRFDPPAPRCKRACPTGCKQVREGTPLEIADYALGYATTLRVRRLGEGLPHLWLLRMSRRDPDERWQRALAGPGRPDLAEEPPAPGEGEEAGP